MPSMPADSLSVRAFGPFTVLVGGQPLPRLRAQTGTLLLAYLVLNAGRDVNRSHLADLLWPDSEGDPLNNLSHALLDLRRALGPAAGRLSRPNKHTLRLDLLEDEADIVDFAALVSRKDLASLERLVAYHRKPLLEGLEAEWIVFERNQRQGQYIQALHCLAAQHQNEGDFLKAREYLRALAQLDILEEAAWLSLLRALAGSKEVALARMVYADWQAHHEPSEEMQALFNSLPPAALQRATEDLPTAQGPEIAIKTIVKEALGDNLRPTFLESEGLFRLLARQGRLVEMRERLKDYLDSDKPCLPIPAPYAWKTLARYCAATGDDVTGQRAITMARTLFADPKNKNEQGLALTSNMESYLAWQRGDYSHSHACLQAALLRWREVGERSQIAGTLNGLSGTYARLGQYAAARACIEESLSLHRELGDRRNEAWDFDALGQIMSREGDYPAASRLHHRAIQTAQEANDREMVAYLSYGCALSALDHRDLATARYAFAECLRYYHDTGERTRIEGMFHLAIELEAEAHGRANKALTFRQARRIAVLWGAWQTMRAELSLPRFKQSERSQILEAKERAWSTLGEPAFQNAEAQGLALTWEEAVQCALDRRK